MGEKNSDVRIGARNAGVYLWQIAERMGMYDTNFSKMLRRELSTEKKEQIFRIIEELRKESVIRVAQ